MGQRLPSIPPVLGGHRFNPIVHFLAGHRFKPLLHFLAGHRFRPFLLFLLTLVLWLPHATLPALEDDKFWWIPQGLIEAQRGPTLFPTGELPGGLLPPGVTPPPQWTGGIPDYAHPPLFFLYLGLWFRLVGPGMGVTHLALLPLAFLAVLGMDRLARRVAGVGSALATSILFVMTPVVVAQVARADLDLGLLAATPWALEALLARRWLRFAVVGGLAAGVKEPGILLVAPAVVAVLMAPRRSRWRALMAAVVPALVLGGWAALHAARVGWGLAEPERLAPDLGSQMRDLFSVARFVLWEQGRAVVSIGVVVALARHRSLARGPFPILATHLLTWVAFFGTVNFLGGDPLRPAGSHLRYLLPALPALFALGALALEAFSGEARAGRSGAEAGGEGAAQRPSFLSAVPWAAWVAAVGLALADWHGAPVGGAERNLFALDMARAQVRIAPRLEALVASGASVWVGSYGYLDFVSPGVGIPGKQLTGLKVYGQDTDPAVIPDGAYVLEAAHGEPLGRLSQQLLLEPVEQIDVHRAWVRLYRVTGRR